MYVVGKVITESSKPKKTWLLTSQEIYPCNRDRIACIPNASNTAAPFQSVESFPVSEA